MIAAVVVAAGRGSRLGGRAKALLRVRGGHSFLAAIVARARAAGASEIVVVAGGPHRAVTEVEAARLELAVVVNPDPSRGMASSVAAGFAFAQAAFSARAALLWPVDHPRVDPDTLARVIAAAREDRAVLPVYRGRGGHPVLVGRALWPELAGCASEPGGVRSLWHARPERIERIAVTDAGVVADVDTPADLRS